jgi:hypothetical protein
MSIPADGLNDMIHFEDSSYILKPIGIHMSSKAPRGRIERLEI